MGYFQYVFFMFGQKLRLWVGSIKITLNIDSSTMRLKFKKLAKHGKTKNTKYKSAKSIFRHEMESEQMLLPLQLDSFPFGKLVELWKYCHYLDNFWKNVTNRCHLEDAFKFFSSQVPLQVLSIHIVGHIFICCLHFLQRIYCDRFAHVRQRSAKIGANVATHSWAFSWWQSECVERIWKFFIYEIIK